MSDACDIIPAWIAREIIPHETAIRRWLSRRWHHVVDVEDVIQEAYCRVASLPSVDHIDNPAGYFHRTANAVVTDMLRRAGIIKFETMTQIEWSNVIDHEPAADRAAEASQDLARVTGLLAQLPETCRKVILLRRVEGLSRKETAARLGVSENDVKNHLVRGLQKVMATIAAEDGRIAAADDATDNEKKAEVIGRQRPR